MRVFFEQGGNIAPSDYVEPSGRRCPHGFERSNACRCFTNHELDPGLEGCAGREFSQHPAEEVVPGIVAQE